MDLPLEGAAVRVASQEDGLLHAAELDHRLVGRWAGLAFMSRRRIASVDAVPTRITLAYLSIWSYRSLIRSHRIGRVIAGAGPGP